MNNVSSYIVGGNLTITGSAANIIVSEKARKLGENVEFFGHYKGFEMCPLTMHANNNLVS